MTAADGASGDLPGYFASLSGGDTTNARADRDQPAGAENDGGSVYGPAANTPALNNTPATDLQDLLAGAPEAALVRILQMKHPSIKLQPQLELDANGRLRADLADGTPLLRFTLKGQYEWKGDWLDGLDPVAVRNILFSEQRSLLEWQLQLLPYLDPDAPEAQTWLELQPKEFTATLRNANGDELGELDLSGFAPAKGFAKSWDQLINASSGELRDLVPWESLSMPDARAAEHLLSVAQVDPALLSSWAQSSADFLEEISLEGSLEDWMSDLMSAWGDPYGREWILSQANPLQIGPDDPRGGWFSALYAGRAESIAVDPNNSDHLIAALLNAGLWRSTDAGRNWISVSDANLGQPQPAVDFAHVAAYSQPDQGDTLLLAFPTSGMGGDGGRRVQLSTDSGESWSVNTRLVNGVVRDTKQIGDKLLLASSAGIYLIDTSAGWDVLSQDLLGAGSPHMLSSSITRATQVKNIPDRLDVALLNDAGGLDTLEVLDLSTGAVQPVPLPDPPPPNRLSIETAPLPGNRYRIYILTAPATDGFPSATATPGLATVWSIDLDRGTDPSSITPDQWVPWGYNAPDGVGGNLFISSVRDALAHGEMLSGANQWWYTREILADPTFPDKLYVGATTLGYVLHPSVPVINSPKERGVNMHVDPAGWNSQVTQPEKGGTRPEGHAGLVYPAFVALITDTGTDGPATEYVQRVESYNHKNHADVQALFTDGTWLYVGNDGGLQRSQIAFREDETSSIATNIVETVATVRQRWGQGLLDAVFGGDGSRVFDALQIDGDGYNWGQFLEAVARGGEGSPLGTGLAELPLLGFGQPNWENLNDGLITNLYQGGHLSADGWLWIAGAQDNGVSVGGEPDTTPYAVSNADGGAGFFGDTPDQVVYTNQNTGVKEVMLEELINPANEPRFLLGERIDADSPWAFSSNLVSNLLLSRDHLISYDLNGNVYEPGAGLGRRAEVAALLTGDFNNPNNPVILSPKAKLDVSSWHAYDPVLKVELLWDDPCLGVDHANQYLTAALGSPNLRLLVKRLVAYCGGNLKLLLTRQSGRHDTIPLDIRVTIETAGGTSLDDGQQINLSQFIASNAALPPGDEDAVLPEDAADLDPNLVIAAQTGRYPYLNVSLNGGDDRYSTLIPRGASGASFYFPTEQHPAKRDLLAVADARRVYVYDNVFDLNRTIAYKATSDLNTLGLGWLNSFSFAPWDRTGNTMLVGNTIGGIYYIQDALTDAPNVLQLWNHPGNDDVSSLAFSHNSREDYEASANAQGDRPAFITATFEDRSPCCQYPLLVLQLSGLNRDGSAADQPLQLNLGPAGGNVAISPEAHITTATDALVLRGYQIYLASDYGVHLSRDHGNTWIQLGGSYDDNLPSTRVSNLEYNPNRDSLFAFTYGRGVYYYQLSLRYPNGPFSDIEVVNIPPDVLEQQFVHPLDLVELEFLLDDPRIRQIYEWNETVGDPIPVDLSFPAVGAPRTLQELRLDPANFSDLGHWVLRSEGAFLSHEQALKGLELQASTTLYSGGKPGAVFSTDVNLSSVIPASFKGPVSTLTLDITDGYNKLLGQLADSKDSSSFAAIVSLEVVSVAGEKLEPPVELAQVLLNPGAKEPRSFGPTPLPLYDAKASSFQVFLPGHISLDQLPQLTPLRAQSGSLGIPNAIAAPLQGRGAAPDAKGTVRAVIRPIKAGDPNEEPLLELVDQDGSGLWWVPEEKGDYLIEVISDQQGPLLAYHVHAVEQAASSLFDQRLKDFERGLAPAGFSTPD